MPKLSKMKLNRLFFQLLFFSIASYPKAVISQITLHGATCVTTGLQYDYFVEGDSDLKNSVTISITGGRFPDTDVTWKEVKIYSKFSISWIDTLKYGTIFIKSNNKRTTDTIKIVNLLNGGRIDKLKKVQYVSYNSIPLSFPCTPASGGGCSPQFEYQWQRSSDQATWTDIVGQTSQSLFFQTALRETTFYRRKVTNKTSGSIAYSNIASAFIEIDIQHLK